MFSSFNIAVFSVGVVLLLIDILNGEARKYVEHNATEKILKHKKAFYAFYIAITLTLYAIPIFNVIVLTLHLVFAKIEKRKEKEGE